MEKFPFYFTVVMYREESLKSLWRASSWAGRCVSDRLGGPCRSSRAGCVEPGGSSSCLWYDFVGFLRRPAACRFLRVAHTAEPTHALSWCCPMPPAALDLREIDFARPAWLVHEVSARKSQPRRFMQLPPVDFRYRSTPKKAEGKPVGTVGNVCRALVGTTVVSEYGTHRVEIKFTHALPPRGGKSVRSWLHAP